MSALDKAIRKATVNLTTPPQRVSADVRAMLGAIATVNGDQVTVTVGADTIPSPYLSGYTPTVGDLVLVLFLKGAPVIAGKITGQPVY